MTDNGFQIFYFTHLAVNKSFKLYACYFCFKTKL